MPKRGAIPVDEDPILSDALKFWSDNRVPPGLPTRAEIDPVRIPNHLFPYLILADVLSPQGLMQYRLVGARMREKWGEDFNKRTSAEIFSGSYRDYLEGAFSLCITERLPVYTESHFRWDVNGYLWTRRLMLPIAETPEGETKQVLVVQTWPNKDGQNFTNPMVVVPGTEPARSTEPELIR